MVVKYNSLIEITRSRIATSEELPEIDNYPREVILGITHELSRVITARDPTAVRSEQRTRRKCLDYLEEQGIQRVTQFVVAFGYFDGDYTWLRALPWVVKVPEKSKRDPSIYLAHQIASDELKGHKGSDFTTEVVAPDGGSGYMFTHHGRAVATLAHMGNIALSDAHNAALSDMVELLPGLTLYVFEDTQRAPRQIQAPR